MTKPKNWDLLLPVEQEAWRAKKRESDRKYREENTEKLRESKRKYREANCEKARELRREQYAANPEKVREWNRKWRESNLEKHRESDRKRMIKFRHKTRQQSAADQFFIMAGAAEQLTKLKPKQ